MEQFIDRWNGVRASAWRRAVAGVIILPAALALASSAVAAPCRGGSRLQVRWSAKAQAAVIALSTTKCAVPARCHTADGAAAADHAKDAAVTQAPISVTVHDATGRTLTATVDPAMPSCGARCGEFANGGCDAGSETHRVADGFVRYVLRARQQASVVVNKLRIPAAEAPTLVTPITVTVRDAAGYTVETEFKKCRTRRSAESMSLFCS